MSTEMKYNRDDLWAKDRNHAFHGWTDYAGFRETGSEILVEADDVYVTDIDGNRMLDGMGGVWCVNIGYGRQEMADVIAEQTLRLPYANPFRCTTTPPSAELVAKLADLAPGNLNHVIFGGGGSTANDAALRIIHLYNNHLGRHNKKQILVREGGYHGTTSVSAALCGIPFHRIGFDVPDIGVNYVSIPNCYRRPDNMSEAEFCDMLVEEFQNKVEAIGAENIAAFYAEPVMGMSGVIVPPEGYFRRLSKICKDNEILIVADEVVTGFGRLGEFFASDSLFEMQPDIISSAKGLTSGYLPMGATIISDTIMDTLATPIQPGSMFTHGYTYAEHPVCCVAALKNIEIMEREDLCGHVRELAPYFKERLSTLNDLPTVGDVRGMGFMLAIENVANKESKELFAPEIAIGDRIAKHSRDMGLIVRPAGHLNILSPPLTLTRDHIDFLVDVLRQAMVKVQDDLVREGLWNA